MYSGILDLHGGLKFDSACSTAGVLDLKYLVPNLVARLIQVLCTAVVRLVLRISY
jgi:hypothetical protein